MKTKYEVIIYWSEEDKAFIAEVPELPGCPADGPTRQAALKHADAVIQEWTPLLHKKSVRHALCTFKC
jgi:predicted RNase H-like HicB family nuclease